MLISSGCEKRYKESRFLLGTIVEITTIADGDTGKEAAKQAFNEIQRLEGLLSIYNKNSEISRINKNAGISAVKVSADTLNVIEKSIEFSNLTNGAFDISIGPLMEIWGFKNKKNRIPSNDELSVKLPLIDYRKIFVDHASSTIRLKMKGMQIDVGGIAAGYAVDKAIQILKEARVKKALVNGGGEIYALNSPSKKKTWKIGIKHPIHKNNILGILELKDRAVSTSGDYENYFEVNGKRYCHIINPKTGKPVEGIMSVTIVADNTTTADVLSTAIFVMGIDDGIKLIKNSKDIDYIIITGKDEKDMNIITSEHIKEKMQFRQ